MKDDHKIETDTLCLVYPAPCYGRDVRAFVRECLNNGEKHIQGGGNVEQMRLGEWLDRQRLERSLPATENSTPKETFLAYRVSDGALIGCCQLRHNLTEQTRICGGNVGYEVRPSMRGQGYGKQILAAVLEHARTIGLASVRLDCDARNVASKSIIEGCGGRFVGTDRVGRGSFSQDVLHYNFDLTG